MRKSANSRWLQVGENARSERRTSPRLVDACRGNAETNQPFTGSHRQPEGCQRIRGDGAGEARAEAHVSHNNGSFGICGVELFRRRGMLAVVLTELHNNPGLSVTNCYEYLATDIAIGLMEEGTVDDPSTVRWIEHYEAWPVRGRLWAQDTWDEVTMEWDGEQFGLPTWRRLEGERTRSPRYGTPLEPHILRV
jgi:hypothetical protein